MTKQIVPAAATAKKTKPAAKAAVAPHKAVVSNSSQPGLASIKPPAPKKSPAKGAKA
jgi:hypothetical protein